MAYYSNKTVWITGASSGIGESLAYALSKQSARIILSARRKDELERVRQNCLKLGADKVSIFTLDLEKFESLAGVTERVLGHHPKIDILINNGGISQRSFAMDTDISVDKKLMDVNYMGTIALSKAVLPSMMKHHIGHIATVTSLVGKFGSPYRSSYAASKHALHGFFDSLRAELTIRGFEDIHITLICPGYIKTNITYNALTKDGSPQDSMDEAQANGMPPQIFAKKCLKAISKKKQEVNIGQKERFGVLLKRFFPSVFARFIAKVKVT